MNTNITIRSSQALDFLEYSNLLEVPGLVLDCHFISNNEKVHWQFYRKDISTTLFSITYDLKNTYIISVDNLAAYEDLKLFPYLVDTLAKHLNANVYTDHIYDLLNEEWIENTIAEEVAHLKGILNILPYYFFAQPFDDCSFLSIDAFYPFGVNLHSSTPRIYGYIQYMIKNDLLPKFKNWDDIPYPEEGIDLEVDIPQHVPIGRVKSWQLDGSETYETYSREDVDHLLELANKYHGGMQLDGVVLNDIGTIHQEGIGMPIDGVEAVYWFTEAYESGDTLYAPTNLGDLYRKGCGTVEPDLEKAFNAYLLSTDPYAHYRIGQAYEEGWVCEPDMQIAMKWYRQAAEEGHHLAKKRLE